MSRQLLEAEGLAIGDVVALSPDPSGQRARAFKIVGTFEPTPDPTRLSAARHEARLHLGDLIALTADPLDPLDSDAVHAINLKLAPGASATDLIRDVQARMAGVAALPTTPADDPDSPFRALERFHFAIAVVTVVGSAAFLLALMVMRVEERRESVGILRLVGFSRRRILLEVLIEGLLIAVGGALFGILAGAAMEGVINAFFQRHYDTALDFVRVTPGIMTRCVALAVPLGVLAGLVASWTLLRRDIVALLRR